MKNIGLNWIKHNISRQKGSVLALAAASSAHSLSLVLFAVSAKGFLDAASGGIKNAVPQMIFMLALVVSMAVLRFLCSMLGEQVSGKMDISLKNRLFSEILNGDYQKNTTYHSGELINMLFSDVSVVVNAATTIIPNAVAVATRLTAIFVTLAYFDIYLIIAFAVLGLFMFVTSRLLRSYVKLLHKKMQEKEGKVRAAAGESLEALAVIKAYGAAEKQAGVLLSAQTEHYKARIRKALISSCSVVGINFFFRCSYVLVLIYCAVLSERGDAMTVGTLTALLLLVSQVQQPFSALSGIMPSYYAALASAERLMQIEENTEQSFEKYPAAVGFGGITLDNITFNYGRESVLTGVSAHIEEGSFTLISGITGQGKSTLFLLLLGLYRYSGRMAFDNGKSIGADTRNMFAYVPQGNMLLSGTVRENICLSANSGQELEKVLCASCCDEFISRLPDGLETNIGEHGCALSEGQAQRIAVARALMSDAPILLLDEATSALDSETEQRLLQNLKNSGKTVIMISHKRAAADICDSHLLLENGRLSRIV